MCQFAFASTACAVVQCRRTETIAEFSFPLARQWCFAFPSQWFPFLQRWHLLRTWTQGDGARPTCPPQSRARQLVWAGEGPAEERNQPRKPCALSPNTEDDPRKPTPPLRDLDTVSLPLGVRQRSRLAATFQECGQSLSS